MGLGRPPAPEIGEPDIDPNFLSLCIGTFKKVSLTLRNPFVDQIKSFQTLALQLGMQADSGAGKRVLWIRAGLGAVGLYKKPLTNRALEKLGTSQKLHCSIYRGSSTVKETLLLPDT